MSVPDAAAERLHALYADELVHSLMPFVHPIVDTRQTQALIRHARAIGPGQCEAPDETTWIWSDLHLGHKVSLGVFFRPFGTVRRADQAMIGRLVRPGRRRRHDRLPGRRQRRRQRPGVPPALVAGGARHQVARARQPGPLGDRYPGAETPARHNRWHRGLHRPDRMVDRLVPDNVHNSAHGAAERHDRKQSTRSRVRARLLEMAPGTLRRAGGGGRRGRGGRGRQALARLDARHHVDRAGVIGERDRRLQYNSL